MGQNIDALYCLRKEDNAYKLDYLIKNTTKNKVYIKAKKRIKNIDLESAHKQSLFYILRNIVALMDLNVINNTSEITIKLDDFSIMQKLNKLSSNSFIKDDSILLLLGKIYNLKYIFIPDIIRIIYNEKRPNLNLYIKAEKKGKDYKKYIRRNNTLEDFERKTEIAKNLIFFDFEMNCLVDFKSVEIVSIGAVKTDFKGNIISKFYECIKPTGIKTLTEKCKEITGLYQKEIDEASSFVEVFQKFSKWLGEESAIFCYWGGNDIAVLKNDFRRNNNKPEVIKEILKNNIDIQEIYCKDILKNENLLSLKNALLSLDTSFDGAEHNSLNDAKNLSRIYKKSKIHHNL